MKEVTILKGSETEGLECTFIINENNEFNTFIAVTLLLFGEQQNIDFPLNVKFREKLSNWCFIEYTRLEKYKSLQTDFKLRFNEDIVIKDEEGYIMMLGLFENKTKDDNSMEDLNGDKDSMKQI